MQLFCTCFPRVTYKIYTSCHMFSGGALLEIGLLHTFARGELWDVALLHIFSGASCKWIALLHILF